MPEDIAIRARQAIEEKVFPGCVVGIVRKNGERHVLPFGRLTYEKDSPEVTEQTIYDVASVTKSIPVASLAALLINPEPTRSDLAQNQPAKMTRSDLGDKVTEYIPELQNDFGATIKDLLRYRVHGPRMSALGYPTFEQLRTHIFEAGFDGPPGKREYSNLPAFLLGIILERVGGEKLPALAHKYFFGPLAMNDTTFFPHDIARIAPTEIVDGKEIRGIVHDESARMFALKRRAVGHAGLFSTAPDLLTFLEALLQGKFPEVVGAAEKGLGWQVDRPWFMGHCGAETFGKTGFTGTSVVVDREKGIGLVILSNRIYPKRPPDASSVHAAINAFRADIADIAFSS